MMKKIFFFLILFFFTSAYSQSGNFSNLSSVTEDKRFSASVEYLETLIDSRQCSDAVSFLKRLFFDARAIEEIDELKPHIKKISRVCDEDLESWSEQPEQKYSLSQSFYRSSNWGDVVKILRPLYDSGKIDFMDKDEAAFRLALAYRWMNDFDNAILFLNSLAGTEFEKRSQLELIKIHMKQNRHDDALKLIQTLLNSPDSSPGSKLDLKKRMAFIHMDKGEFDIAIDKWSGILKFLHGKNRAQAIWNIGWCYYRKNNFQNAIRYFKLLDTKKSKLKERSIYWQARSYEKMGENNKADVLYRQLSSKRSFGYYQSLACPPRSVGACPRDSVGVADRRLAPRVPNAVAGARASGLAPVSYYVWENHYSMEYKEIIENEIKNSQTFDPDIVYSIIKNESNYRPKVVSEAGAVGLMQLMPMTAKKYLKENERFVFEKLFEPEYNVRLGVRYLMKLNEMFGGDLASIAASYNAGEEAVLRWKEISKGLEMDEWIEEIPYAETNNYVKKVLSTYWTLKKNYTQ